MREGGREGGSDGGREGGREREGADQFQSYDACSYDNHSLGNRVQRESSS